MNFLAYLYWDPPKEIFSFSLPFLGRPLLWYGFCFAMGFFLGYLVLLYLLKRYLSREIDGEAKVKSVAESLSVYVILGTIIGARLGDVLFYQDFAQNLRDPFAIFKIWEGGLASHGGVLGIIIALSIYARKISKKIPSLSWRVLLDLVAIPAALAGACIRIGNFINQEILGSPTSAPWGVVFGHPVDGSLPIARHPVQLYEAMGYLAIFCLLLFLRLRWKEANTPGKISGLFFVLAFGFRIYVERFKIEQSVYDSFFTLFQMGQLLSLPLIALGIGLFFYRSSKSAAAEAVERH